MHFITSFIFAWIQVALRPFISIVILQNHGLNASSLESSKFFQRLRATLCFSPSLDSPSSFLRITLIRVTVFPSPLSDTTRSRVSPTFTYRGNQKENTTKCTNKCVPRFGIHSRSPYSLWTHRFTFLDELLPVQPKLVVVESIFNFTIPGTEQNKAGQGELRLIKMHYHTYTACIYSLTCEPYPIQTSG